MVFLFSRNFPDRRLLSTALQSFFGLGPNNTSRLLARFHLHSNIRMRDLTSPQILELNAHLDGLKIENELKREVLRNISRLRDIGTYRGRRHAMGLPVRGQRTRTQIKSVWRLNKVERNLVAAAPNSGPLYYPLPHSKIKQQNPEILSAWDPEYTYPRPRRALLWDAPRCPSGFQPTRSSQRVLYEVLQRKSPLPTAAPAHATTFCGAGNGGNSTIRVEMWCKDWVGVKGFVPGFVESWGDTGPGEAYVIGFPAS